MSTIVWILNFLPDTLFVMIAYLCWGAGFALYIASKLVKWIPMMSTYKLPAEVVGILAALFGAYLFGSHATNVMWQERVKEMEAKVAVAEAKSKETNTKIVTKLVTKTQVIKTRGEDIVKYVDREVVKYDDKFAKGGECEIPKEFIKAINDAAEAPK